MTQPPPPPTMTVPGERLHTFEVRGRARGQAAPRRPGVGGGQRRAAIADRIADAAGEGDDVSVLPWGVGLAHAQPDLLTLTFALPAGTSVTTTTMAAIAATNPTRRMLKLSNRAGIFPPRADSPSGPRRSWPFVRTTRRARCMRLNIPRGRKSRRSERAAFLQDGLARRLLSAGRIKRIPIDNQVGFTPYPSARRPSGMSVSQTLSPIRAARSQTWVRNPPSPLIRKPAKGREFAAFAGSMGVYRCEGVRMPKAGNTAQIAQLLPVGGSRSPQLVGSGGSNGHQSSPISRYGPRSELGITEDRRSTSATDPGDASTARERGRA